MGPDGWNECHASNWDDSHDERIVMGGGVISCSLSSHLVLRYKVAMKRGLG